MQCVRCSTFRALSPDAALLINGERHPSVRWSVCPLQKVLSPRVPGCLCRFRRLEMRHEVHAADVRNGSLHADTVILLLSPGAALQTAAAH